MKNLLSTLNLKAIGSACMGVAIAVAITFCFGLLVAISVDQTEETEKNVVEYILPTTVEGIDEYRDLIEDLHNATSNDVFILHDIGTGGSVITFLVIANAIEDSEAHVILEVDGPAFSAHANLACYADEVNMNPGSFLMFHTIQQRTLFGQIPLLYDDAPLPWRKVLDQLKQKCVTEKGIFTEQHFSDMVNKGAEIYVLPDGTIETVQVAVSKPKEESEE